MMWGLMSSEAGLTDIREAWSQGHEVLTVQSVYLPSCESRSRTRGLNSAADKYGHHTTT